MGKKKSPKPATRGAQGPRSYGSSKAKNASWTDSIRDFLLEAPAGASDSLENDLQLLQSNSSRNDKKDASNRGPNSMETEDLIQAALSKKHYLSVGPEVFKVLYQRHANSLRTKIGIDFDRPPLSRIENIFDDIAVKAESLGFKDVLRHLGSRKLRVVTVCSGTESPLLALKLFSDSFYRLFGQTLDIEHLFSAEIVPFKQAYIERNFHPPIIFRDVKELKNDKATTAYGAVHEVPVGADIMVAGFSCVDYSNLNRKKKKSGEAGESRDTFYATLNYAKKCRPPLIVLENVSGAPWPSISQNWEDIGYSATHIKVDTKNYYLPQTRERGYMLCVDKHIIDKRTSGNDPNSRWSRLMDDFKRPASSPVERFLLDDHDTRVQRIRREISTRTTKDGKVHGWSAYKTRHQMYRVQEKLGNKRPLTRWQDNGSCKMPDFSWKDWSKVQPERVWDTLDMNFLRSIYRGYDLNYKLRVLELSQGIDREVDTRAFGVVGCITPTGIPYITTRGGPLLGIEALAVQGIPVNDLLLTRETQRELQDLAGNAMSSTAVGAAILSALIVGFKMLSAGPPGSALPVSTTEKFQLSSLNEQNMDQQSLDLSSFCHKPVNEILDLSLKGSRLCRCEGRTSVTKKDIKVCSQCAHTACTDCAGNPSHGYKNISVEEFRGRILPVHVADELKNYLPMRFTLQGISIDSFGVFDPDNTVYNGPIWTNFLEAVIPALGEVLNFRDISRGKTWVVHYDGAHSKVKLVLSASGATWFLYVKTPMSEASNSILRQMLSQPVAEMSPSGESLFIGQWKIFSPLSSSMSLSVVGEGTKCESFASRMGLESEDYASSKVWTQLRITSRDEDIAGLGQDISGVYELLPECGSASGSLHKKVSRNPVRPIYLFLDPSRLGLPELDSFVFCWEHDRLDEGDSRVTIAEISPLWRPSRVHDDPSSVQCFYRKKTACEEASIQKIESDPRACCWTPRSDFVLDLGGTACHESHITLLAYSIPAEGSGLPWTEGDWSIINLMESPSILQDFAWLIQRFRSSGPFAEWREPNLQSSNSEICSTCAPQQPKIVWAWNSKKQTRPYEDPVEAGVFERQLKDRPPPFVAFTRVDEHGVGHLHISVNVTTLIHQASAKLNMGNRTTLHWRISVEDPNLQDADFPRFIIKNNRHNPEHAQPPGFKAYKLRPEQLRSLSWMAEQESDEAPPYVEEEVEEAILAPMNWRAEGRATASKFVRGGILADDVGYGKTATVLGLIDYQFSTGMERTPNSIDGSIPIKATLIVVPAVLVPQWTSEIRKFLGRKYKLLVLSKTQSLGMVNMQDYLDADIILANWAILQGEAYYEKLEKFAASPKIPPQQEGRVFSNWFIEALIRLKDQINVLTGDGPKSLLESIQCKRQQLEEDAAYSRYDPSKRLRGSAYVEAQKREEAKNDQQERSEPKKRKREDDDETEDLNEDADKTAAEPSDKKTAEEIFGLAELSDLQDWKRIKSPLFHMFEFNRIVIDEFTYVSNKSYASLVALSSRKKWILSGTPPVSKFADVKTFSPLLGINLGVDDEVSGKPGNLRLKEIQKGRSAAENFHSFKTSHSVAWHQHRHEVAQKFLDQFMRQNVAEIDEIPCTEHVCPIVLTSAERAIYIELYIQLMSQGLNPRKGIQGSVDNDQAERLRSLIKNCKTPREALQKRCSMFDPERLSGDTNDATLSCNAIVQVRERQIGVLGQDIEKKFKLALWLESNYAEPATQLDNLRSIIANHSLGDESVSLALQAHLQNAVQNAKPEDGDDFYREADEAEPSAERAAPPRKKAKKPATKKSRQKDIKISEAELLAERPTFPVTQQHFKNDIRDVASLLRKLFDEALSRARALRLLKAIRSFQELVPREPHLRNCSKCGYEPPSDGQMFILGQCGHVLCETCVISAEAHEQCLVGYCQGSALEYHILRTRDLGRDQTGKNNIPYGGKKFEEIVNLIKDKSRIAEDDQVILFVQFDQLIGAAEAALQANEITYCAIKSNSGGGSTVQEFKNVTKRGKSKAKKYKVLILNLSGETAAGLNLQNANHVIFLSPVLSDSQYDYESTMTQTIGRCRRYGQKKRVHVYHFVALETTDVNVLQHRRQQILVERNGQFLLVPEDQVLETDKANWRGPSLDGVHATGNFDE